MNKVLLSSPCAVREPFMWMEISAGSNETKESSNGHPQSKSFQERFLSFSSYISSNFPGKKNENYINNKTNGSFYFETTSDYQKKITELHLRNIFTLNRCMERLEEIRALPYNWNENGASAFSSELIDMAKNLVVRLSVQPDIFPTGRDSIQMEYRNKMGDYLEFELYKGGCLDMFSCTADDITEEKNNITWQEADKLVREFYDNKG